MPKNHNVKKIKAWLDSSKCPKYISEFVRQQCSYKTVLYNKHMDFKRDIYDALEIDVDENPFQVIKDLKTKVQLLDKLKDL